MLGFYRGGAAKGAVNINVILEEAISLLQRQFAYMPFEHAEDLEAQREGVKLIGATSHFVTNELDEGPIIAQQVIPVNHSFTAAGMMKAGQEIEVSVLARALRLVFTDRVFVYENKTVVFE